MPLPDTYLRRKLQINATIDIYEYAHIPKKVRIQVYQIFQDGLGSYYRGGERTPSAGLYDQLVLSLRRELGVHELAKFTKNAFEEFYEWFEVEPDTDYWLVAIELVLRLIDRAIRENAERFRFCVKVKPDAAIEEFNARLREAAIGYQYVNGDIVRVDSFPIHAEVVLPALALLADPKFQAANQEYRNAHHAHRMGKQDDCVVNCGRAFESVLKIIGAERGWDIKPNDTASKLIKASVDAGFLAAYHDGPLNSLRGLIEGSAPTIRNKEGGHGGGTKPIVVPEHLAAYQLHQTAAVILFLAEQDRILR